MKYTSTIVAIFIAITTLSAQRAALRGKVTDAYKRVISAVVSLPELKRGTDCDISEIPAGTFTVRVSSLV